MLDKKKVESESHFGQKTPIFIYTLQRVLEMIHDLHVNRKIANKVEKSTLQFSSKVIKEDRQVTLN